MLSAAAVASGATVPVASGAVGVTVASAAAALVPVASVDTLAFRVARDAAGCWSCSC